MEENRSEMEQLLELVKKSDCKLTIRFEKEYDTYLFKMKKYCPGGDHETYRHIYESEVDDIVPDLIQDMMDDIALDEEEDLNRIW